MDVEIRIIQKLIPPDSTVVRIRRIRNLAISIRRPLERYMEFYILILDAAVGVVAAVTGCMGTKPPFQRDR